MFLLRLAEHMCDAKFLLESWQPEYGMCEFLEAQCSLFAISDHHALTNFKARVHTQSHMQVTMLELRRILWLHDAKRGRPKKEVTSKLREDIENDNL